ncbi:hypothetical protein Cylst_0688 [Cylindrospermum stagnale PCC 7417]|uniref:Uncharacterized protein n=1 Tax=Cylindrospermum stagnale PCC 7417 TaxID=56107 RepID=K9WTA6_9NOST|nr:hypothetical protein [Cylindrospermum stagnale]AFZ23016.1 hypothetical protein Cylst_0688 [Cylindrospermum stagnale PCC 7417]
MRRFLSVLLAGLIASVSVLSAFESADAAPRNTRYHGHHGKVYYRRHNRRSYHRLNHRRSRYRRHYRRNHRIRLFNYIYIPRRGYGRWH